MGIECEPSCPIILGRPFLRTVGAVVDMNEGNIKFQSPLKKGMEHFPRKKIKLPFESFTRASYFLDMTSSFALCLAQRRKRKRLLGANLKLIHSLSIL